MKKIFAISTLVSMILMGCSNFDEPNYAPAVDCDLLYAAFSDETRTYVEEGKYLRWHEDDRITAFYGNTLNRQYKFKGKTGDNSGTFSLVPSGELGTGNELSSIYAVYPYDEDITITDKGVISLSLPATQNYAEESFGRGANTMIAVTENVEDTFLMFRNACGYLKLQLYGEDIKVATIEVKGNNDEKIAGSATTTMAFGGVPSLAMADDATTAVTLDCGDGVVLGSTEDAATEFWVVLPAMTFEKGITITVTDTAGGTFEKSTTNEVVIERNMIQPMAAIAAEFPLQIPDNEIWYTATAKLEPNKTSSYWPDYYSIESNEWDEITGKGVITFRDKVTSIGVSVFSDKSILKSIILPNTITSIGDYAFEDCSNLISITIPDSVTRIGIRAFKDCVRLENFKGKFASADGNCLVVDGVLNSFAPVGILEYTIPNSVTEIGVWVFNQCSNLTKITIPGSVVKIGEGAFAYCSGLTNITIPNSVTEIGDYAFYECTKIKGIYIPSTTPPTMGESMFSYRMENVKIYVPADSILTYLTESSYSEYVNYIVAYDFEKEAVVETKPYNEIYYTSSDGVIVIPNVTNAFSANIVSNTYENGKGVISFDAPITSIGEKAFYNCSSLTSITIPDSVTSIGNNAFNGCSGLTSVNISDLSAWCKISFEDKFANPLYYAKQLYLNGELVTELTIPSDITEIKSYAFNCCSSLTSIIIPDSVASIGNYAFEYCSSLTSVTIPNSVTSIGKWAFYNCSSLTSVNISDLSAWCKISFEDYFATPLYYAKQLYLNGELVTELTIPSDITEIKSYTFYNCSCLTSVTIPDSVTSIGNYAFEYCSSLTSVTIPDNVTSIGGGAFYGCKGELIINSKTLIEKDYTSSNYPTDSDGWLYGSKFTKLTIGDNITKIGNYAFSLCGSLTGVTIPDSITSIGNYAFSSCRSLTSVNIPNSVTSIGESAFRYCSSLTSITIPDSVTSIGESAFSACSSLPIIDNIRYADTYLVEAVNKTLESYIIKQGTRFIGSYAFSNCSSLTSITIPDSVTSIGSYAFYDCSRLTSVNISDLSAWCKISFEDYFATPLYYAKQLYLNGELVTELTIPSDITEIKSYTFYNCSCLTSVTIPDSVTSIGNYAFEYCSSLTSITIPDSVTSIGYSAFEECSSLTSITIPDSVTSIGNYAFYNCSRLKSVTIGNSVTSIEKGAFFSCSSLISIYCKPTIPPAIYYYYYSYSSNSYTYSYAIPFNSGMKIYVPRSSYGDYMQYSTYSNDRTAPANWFKYESYIEPYDF